MLSKLNFYKQKALNRIFSHRLNMTHLYREMHTEQFMARAVNDNAILFWDYEDYVRFNLEIFRSYAATRNLSAQQMLCMEFGVFKAYSINFMSDILKECQFYGFDSFDGFRSVKKTSFWNSYQRGFSEQTLPAVNANVHLIKGYVEDTFCKFLEGHVDGKEVIFIHCDMDIYEPTKVVLDWVVSSQKKCFMMFDELINYNEFPLHEYRAFLETIVERNVPFRIRSMCDRGLDTYGALGKVFLEIQ